MVALCCYQLLFLFLDIKNNGENLHPTFSILSNEENNHDSIFRDRILYPYVRSINMYKYLSGL